MLSYLPAVVDASRTAESAVTGTPADTVAIRAADLQVLGAGAVTVKDAAPSAGELALFCRPVVTAPALPRRDGSVLADGWLPDWVRLGELERHLGGEVIEEIVAAAQEQGRLKQRQRRRIMSYPLVIRLMLAMTLMPGASYCEALARLAGLLADVPFALAWHVPTAKVITDWRRPVPADLMEALFWRAAGPLVSDDDPSAVLLAGMAVCAADGMLVNIADTPANQRAFGCTGTASQDGAGAAPFPQVRIVAVTARAGRGMLGAILGSTRAGEQTLLARLVRRRPDLFAGRVICFDRNFPGHDLVSAIVDAGGYVVARVKQGISLPVSGSGWLPDGSRMTWLNAPSGKTADRLPVRAAEHNAVLPCGDGEEVSETCTLITTLLDHRAAPADAVREAYLTRWSASENHVRGRQGHDHRRGEPDVRPGAALRLPAPGHPGSLGLAGRHPAGPRQRRRGPAQRRRRSTRPPPQGQRSGHHGRGILHRRPSPFGPLHDLFPGHGVVVAGRHGRRSRRRRPRRPAYPERHRAGTPLRARAESPPEIPAHHRDETDRHRETQGHRIHAQRRVSRSQAGHAGKEEPPRHAGPRTVEPRAIPAATRGQKPRPDIIARHHGKRLKDRHRTRDP